MGYFHEMVEVVNRTSGPLNVRFDGQDITIPPNYDEIGDRIEGVVNMIPKIALPYALNQNVRMGSEKPEDPSSFVSLLGIVEPSKKKKKDHSWHDITFLEQSDEPTRVPVAEMLADDPFFKGTKIGGKKHSATDAGVGSSGTTPFDLRVT